MKARATLILVLVLSLALVPLLATVPAHAQTGYSERLDVYTAGTNAFFTITLDRLGATIPAITSVEGTSGLNSFTLIAMSSTGATSDLQVFGVDGYNPLHLPSEPSEGLFLTVDATSQSADASVVSDLDSSFATTFTQVSTSGSSVTYFAPVDFANVAVPLLYELVPSSLGGFASFVSQAELTAIPMPFMEVTGSYNGTGFSNTVGLGGAATGVLTTATNALNLSELIGSANATITTSSSSTLSEVAVHSLDGVIVTSDEATVSNHIGNFSGSYYLQVAAGQEVKANATIETEPPAALAYRVLDHGDVADGSLLGVSVVVSNDAVAGSPTIENVTLKDNWWQNYPSVFELATGNSTFTIPSIAAGSNFTETYVLRVISTAASQVMIPATSLSFTYQLSNSTFTGHAKLGQQLLQVNQANPSVTAVVKPTLESGVALGTSGEYAVTLTNIGNSSAIGVSVDGQSAGTLVQNGGTSTLNIPINLVDLAQNNITNAFVVSYTDTAGQSLNTTTNTVQLVFSHDSMLIPFVQVSVNDSVTSSTLAAKTMNVTYTFSNNGKANPTAIAATETFPQGVTCTKASLIGTCTGSTYTLATSTLPTSGENNLNLSFSSDNYIVQPTTIVSTYDGLQLHTSGGAYVIPAGISLTKSFSPDTGFPGTSSTATLGISNVGTSPIYNVTIGSGFDKFDLASNSSETTDKTFSEISPGGGDTFSYGIVLSSAAYGNVTGALPTANFLIGGAEQEISGGNSSALVYVLPSATVTSSPSSPEEGHDFTLTVTVINAAPVAVSDIVYTLNLPSEVSVVSGGTLSNHQVTLTLGSLAANTNENLTLTVRANQGLTIDTSTAHLSFQYLGTTLTGSAISSSIVVRIDETTTYTLPIAVAIVVGILAVVFVRSRAGTVAKP